MTSTSTYFRNDAKPWCLKDKQGMATEIENQKDIFIPFKIDLPAGHSTFTVQVPKRFLNRKFSFDTIMLLPTMYSDQAAFLDLETESELEEEEFYPIGLKAKFSKNVQFWPSKFENNSSMKTVAIFINAINNFFEVDKPNGVAHLGCFFDWIDTRFENVGDTEQFDEYMQEMAFTYYGENFDPLVHYDALPLTARSIPFVNNYQYPTEWTENLTQYVRIRLFIAPNATVVFSTYQQLNSMGFDNVQLGPRDGNKQIRVANNMPTGYRIFVANNPITQDFPAKLNISESVNAILVKKDQLKIENFLLPLQKSFQELENNYNLQFNVSLDMNQKKFTFRFPQNPNILDAAVVLSSELSEKLGFEMVTIIEERNKTGNRVMDIDVKDTTDKAKALSYDTALLMILDAVNDVILHGAASEKYMAALIASTDGIFQMKINENCLEMPYLILPDVQTSLENYPLKFAICKFLENGQMVNFIWKEGAKVIGVLRGTSLFAVKKV
jgi:hypothetical protein